MSPQVIAALVAVRMTNHHPDDLREVSAAASKRLMLVVTALQRHTATMNLNRKEEGDARK